MLLRNRVNFVYFNNQLAMCFFASLCGLFFTVNYLTFKVDDSAAPYLSSYQRRYLRILMGLLWISTFCACVGVLNLAFAYFYINMPLDVCDPAFSGPVTGGLYSSCACAIISLYLVNGQHLLLILKSMYEYDYVNAIRHQLGLLAKEEENK